MAKKRKKEEFETVTVELTPALRDAITQVFNDGQQNWDRGQGWPPEDNAIEEQYRQVKALTNYAKDPDDD